MNQDNYYVRERESDYGVVTVTYTPKESECEFCNRENNTRKMEVLYYRDKDNYRQSKYLCIHCYVELKQLV